MNPVRTKRACLRLMRAGALQLRCLLNHREQGMEFESNEESKASLLRSRHHNHPFLEDPQSFYVEFWHSACYRYIYCDTSLTEDISRVRCHLSARVSGVRSCPLHNFPSFLPSVVFGLACAEEKPFRQNASLRNLMVVVHLTSVHAID